MSADLRVRAERGVVSLCLDRPQRRNALTTSVLDELRAALRGVADDPAARAVVLSGAGPAFCAGADLTEMPRDAPPDAGTRRVRLVAEVVELLRSIEVPTIAAVHGAAVGAGWGLALACDTCLAAPGATFALPEVPKGFRLPAGVVRRLAEVAGPVRAADLVLSGRTLTAEDALALGVVARVVPAGDLLATACDLASTLAAVRRDRVRAALGALRRSTAAAAEFAWTGEERS